MTCDTHEKDVLLCSCGFKNFDHLPKMTVMVSEDFHDTWEGLWDKFKLQKEWGLWPDPVREVYLYWRELALDFTDDRELAANFAIERALSFRRSKACGTANRNRTEKQLDLA